MSRKNGKRSDGTTGQYRTMRKDWWSWAKKLLRSGGLKWTWSRPLRYWGKETWFTQVPEDTQNKGNRRWAQAQHCQSHLKIRTEKEFFPSKSRREMELPQHMKKAPTMANLKSALRRTKHHWGRKHWWQMEEDSNASVAEPKLEPKKLINKNKWILLVRKY